MCTYVDTKHMILYMHILIYKHKNSNLHTFLWVCMHIYI